MKIGIPGPNLPQHHIAINQNKRLIPYIGDYFCGYA